MKITDDVRKFAARQNLSADEVLNAGMEQKAREFKKSRTEFYAKISVSCELTLLVAAS